MFIAFFFSCQPTEQFIDSSEPAADTAIEDVEDIIEDVILIDVFDSGPTIYEELIGSGYHAAADAGVGRVLLSGVDKDTILRDIRSSDTNVLEWVEGDINAALSYNDYLLLSIGNDLWTWDGELWESPLETFISGTTTKIQRDYWGDIWLMAEHLYRWRDGSLQSFSVGETTVHQLWAVDGMVGNWHVTWMQIDNQMIAVDIEENIREEVTWTDIRQIVTDADGNTWVNDGGNIRIRMPHQDWVTVPLPELCTDILGNKESPSLWLRCTDPGIDGEYQSDDDVITAYMGSAAEGLARIDVSDGEWLFVDPSGRLLLHTVDGVSRLSGEPWLRIIDLPETLDSNALLVLYPSQELGITSLMATIGIEAPIELGTMPPWEVLLSPLDFSEADLDNGVLDISFDVQWENGETVSLTESIRVLDSVANWDDNIQPLHATHCAVCHSSTAATQLDSKQDWIDNIDNILLQVTSNTMPLGQDPLTPDQLDLIQTWKDNGFQ